MAGPLSNARHERFAQELARGKSASEAYVEAGYEYNEGNASRLKGNEKVSARIAELKAAAAARVEIDQSYVISTIVRTVERCQQSEPVLDRKGDPVMVETPEGEIAPAFTFNATAVLKGSELLGKHLGMFVERHEHTGKDGGPIETVDIPMDEAARRMAFLLSKAAKQPTAH